MTKAAGCNERTNRQPRSDMYQSGNMKAHPNEKGQLVVLRQL